MRSTAAIVLLALPLGGCPPDLDRYRVEWSDTDGGTPPGDGGDGAATGGPCAVPYLLVAVENLGGGPGRVLRFELGDELPLHRCGDLTADGQMLAQPFAVAWVDEHRVAVATTDTVQVVDPADDSLTWTAMHAGLWPNDAFRLETPAGRRLAVAYSAHGTSSDIRELRVYDDAGGVAQDLVGNGGDLPIGLGVGSMTQSPLHHDRLLALKSFDYAAAEIDPWAQVAYVDPPYAKVTEGTVLESVFGLEADQQNRVAWVGHDDDGSHVYYVLDPDGTSDRWISMPMNCAGRPCTFVHAVPDPSLNTRLLALCEEDGDYASRRVVRFRSTAAECEVLFEAESLPDAQQRRMARMSVAWEADR